MALTLPHFSEKVKKHTLVPTKILTTDIYSDNFFRREFTETIKLGSVRYNHLLNYPVVFTAKNKILCSLFLDEIETISMVKKIVEMSKEPIVLITKLFVIVILSDLFIKVIDLCNKFI